MHHQHFCLCQPEDRHRFHPLHHSVNIGPGTDRSLLSDLFPGKKLTQIQIWSECVIDGGRLGKFVLEIKLMFCNSEIVTKTYYFPTVISQLFILESPAWLQIVTFHWQATLYFHQESLIVIDDEIIACI